VITALLLEAGVAAGQATTPAPVPLPPGDYVVSTSQSRSLLVLSPTGRQVGTVPQAVGPYGAQGIALSADRRSAYVSMRMGDTQAPNLYQVDLATGAKHVVASGLNPAVSPDGTKLAYLVTVLAPAGDSYVVTGLAILDLRTGRSAPSRRPRGGGRRAR
jgi:hypothetical protein